MNDIQKIMIEEFQCPGCVCGENTKCVELFNDGSCFYCKAHVLGTYTLGVGSWALGIPKGFCRPGLDTDRIHFNQLRLRMFESPKDCIGSWNKFNVAVWALERDGYLFVRTYMPRVNQGMTDIIKDGSLSLVPNAIDVGPFCNEMD